MRTPPPVLPAAAEEDSAEDEAFFDRHAKAIKTIGYAGMALLLLPLALMIPTAKTVGNGLNPAALGALVIASPVFFWMIRRGSAGIAAGTADIMQAYTLPSGKSTPYEEQYSAIETLAVRGDVDGALTEYEAVISAHPELTAPRMRAAEHYARGRRNPARAAELLRDVLRIPGVAQRDAIYASNRLVDLYDGPLDDPGKALVEMRRIVELHPQSTLAGHLRSAMPEMKNRLAARLKEQG